MQNILDAVDIMLVKALSDIRNHRPVKMRHAYAAKLLQALELKQYSNELKCRVDTVCRTNVGLFCVKPFL